MLVSILGTLEVHTPDGCVEIPGRRLRALLIRLALEPGRVVSADRLIGDLWGQDPPAAAQNALQALVSRLRAVIGRGAIESGSGGYRLSLPAESVDVVRFEQGVRAGRAVLAAARDGGGDPAEAARLFRAALGLWRGPALVDVEGMPFAEAETAGLEEQRIATIEDQVDAVLAAGLASEIGELLPELEHLRSAYPLREALHVRYLKSLYAVGRQAEALSAYEQLRQTLADQLGVDPAAATTELHLAMLRQDPKLPSVRAAQYATSVPPVTTMPPGTTESAALSADLPDHTQPQSAPTRNGNGSVAVVGSAAAIRDSTSSFALSPSDPLHAPSRGNLPAQLTSFIGRESELELVGRLLRGARLVTLIGPGGAGKTRLAQECGVRLGTRSPDGIWFVPLAAVADGADVAQAVLTALGADDASRLAALALELVDTMTPMERLKSLLAGQQLVLILDNCEHVLDSVAELVDQVLAAAPAARVLATSREPLALTGETLCPVSSLALPPEPTGDPQPFEGQDAESALEYAAVRLFAERAQAVRPGYRITAVNVEPVTRICRALDGIPLAIELAAARLRSLTAHQVADRLGDRFRLLSSGSRTALPRHQTLRAIVDWSWDLLEPAERRLLARLSVFAGGATPDTVTPVCSKPTSQPSNSDARLIEPDDVIDLVASLVDKSLVVAQEDEAGEVRYRLLQTVRAYAAEKLAEYGELDAVRAAHTRVFLALAEHADPYLRGADQLHWITRLTLERDNLNAAIRHAVATDDVALSLRFFQASTWFWMMRSRESEAMQWAIEISALLERTGSGAPDGLDEAYTMCTGFNVMNAVAREHVGEVDVIGEALLEIAPPASARVRHPLLALVRPIAVILVSRTGGEDDAHAAFDALAEHPDPWVRAASHAYSALLDLQYARPREAEAAMRVSYARMSELGDRLGLMFVLILLTEHSLASGRFDEAVRQAEEAYGYATEGLGGDSGSMMLVKLGQARALAGEVEAGRRLMEQGAKSAERFGEFSEAAAGRSELAALALRLGDRAEARRQLAEAIELIESRAEHKEAGLAFSAVLSRQGYLAALEGEFEAAREHYRRAVDLVRGSPLLSFMAGLDEVVRGLAALAGLEGDHTRAAELLGSAYSVVGMDNKASYSDGATRAAALAALGEEAFEKCFTRGRRLPKTEVLALEP